MHEGFPLFVNITMEKSKFRRFVAVLQTAVLVFALAAVPGLPVLAAEAHGSVVRDAGSAEHHPAHDGSAAIVRCDHGSACIGLCCAVTEDPQVFTAPAWSPDLQPRLRAGVLPRPPLRFGAARSPPRSLHHT